MNRTLCKVNSRCVGFVEIRGGRVYAKSVYHIKGKYFHDWDDAFDWVYSQGSRDYDG